MQDKVESSIDYIKYFIHTLTDKPLLFMVSTIIASIVTFIISIFSKLSDVLAINIIFGYIFISLALVDVSTGILKNRVGKEKEDFSSSKFFKKPLLVMFFIFIVWILQGMIIGLDKYPHIENSIFEGILTSGIFLIESIKLGLLIFYIIYELTSLRENFLKLGFKDFVRIIDFIIVPLQKFSDYIVRKINKVVEDDENEQDKIKENGN